MGLTPNIHGLAAVFSKTDTGTLDHRFELSGHKFTLTGHRICIITKFENENHIHEFTLAIKEPRDNVRMEF